MKKFLTRTASGAVLLLILSSAFIVGNYYLWGLFVLISFVGMQEVFNATKTDDKTDLLKYIAFVGMLAYYATILLFAQNLFANLIFVIILTLLIMMCVCVFDYPKYKLYDISRSLFTFCYVGIMLSFVYLTRQSEMGIYLVWLIIISSWGCDTCAYLVGCTIGKHRLAPVLSPKKSIEGSVGGSLGAMGLGALFGLYLSNYAGVGSEYVWKFAIISFAASICSQIGDLMASAIKREFGVKDYGKFIPGHGGVMDRFDSVIVTAPIIYFLGAFLR